MRRGLFARYGDTELVDIFQQDIIFRNQQGSNSFPQGTTGIQQGIIFLKQWPDAITDLADVQFFFKGPAVQCLYVFQYYFKFEITRIDFSVYESVKNESIIRTGAKS